MCVCFFFFLIYFFLGRHMEFFSLQKKYFNNFTFGPSFRNNNIGEDDDNDDDDERNQMMHACSNKTGLKTNRPVKQRCMLSDQ